MSKRTLNTSSSVAVVLGAVVLLLFVKVSIFSFINAKTSLLTPSAWFLLFSYLFTK